jgi:hypothetical protein
MDPFVGGVVSSARARDAVHGCEPFHRETIVGSTRAHMSRKRQPIPAHFEPLHWTIRRDDASREQVI